MIARILLFSSLLAAGARADDSFVFVHQNRTVALHRAGQPDLTLFGKGREPALAPDGKRVFYWAEPGDASLMVAEAGQKPSVWRAGNLRSPDLSPDGKMLTWGEMVDGEWAVMISPAGRPMPRVLFRGRESVFHPAWMPDGSAVLTGDLDHVFLVAPDGSLLRTLQVAQLTGGAASISSSDRFRVQPGHLDRILFSAEVSPSKAMEKQTHGEPSSALFLYDLATKTRTRLTPPEVFAVEPAWSRDGAAIYFRGFRVGAKPLRDGILRMTSDGKNLERAAPGSEPGT